MNGRHRIGVGTLTAALVAAPGCFPQRRLPDPAAALERDVVVRQRAAAAADLPGRGLGSIWTDAATVSLVADTRAARAGDLLTVRIVEETSASQEATTGLGKNGTVKLGVPALGGYEQTLANKWPNFDPTNIYETDTQKSFQGQGATARKTLVDSHLTARVLGVYPNGDLAILGRKDVEVNHERQLLTLVGIVRAADLDTTNTVSSDRIAELTVHFGGRGDINDQQREGWFSRLIQKVWPF